MIIGHVAILARIVLYKSHGKPYMFITRFMYKNLNYLIIITQLVDNRQIINFDSCNNYFVAIERIQPSILDSKVLAIVIDNAIRSDLPAKYSVVLIGRHYVEYYEAIIKLIKLVKTNSNRIPVTKSRDERFSFHHQRESMQIR